MSGISSLRLQCSQHQVSLSLAAAGSLLPSDGVSEQPREEWKGIQQPSHGGNDCFTLRSPLREEGPEVGTSEQEEGPASSPASIPKHFMVQL